MRKIILALGTVVSMFLLFSVQAVAQANCTVIAVGKKASVDGSVITSQTGCCPECRLHVVPAQSFKKDNMAPVYYGLRDLKKSLHNYGEIIGYIPQVENTFAYFHTGYPHMNEHQLAIGESTIPQKKKLITTLTNGKQIMTIEQAQLFALQRCKTAKEAAKLIGSLMEKYGFVSTDGWGAESLCIADTNEIWVFEVFGVGAGWSPESGKPGAVWAAQRLPDDHVTIVPNFSIIKEINPEDSKNFLVSEYYVRLAVELGLYDPKSGKSFNWQETYSPVAIEEGEISRFWLFYSTVAPNYREWPDKKLSGKVLFPNTAYESVIPVSYKAYDAYHQFYEPLSLYPFSVKPEKKLSVQDVIAFQRSVFEGTIYDMTADLDWLVPDGKGAMVKSPLTTPFPTKDVRELLDITWRRNVSMGGYGMVAQLRGWLPAPIGGIYWFYLDNQYTSTYVPIYAGVEKISPLYNTYDPDNYSDESARWAIDFVDNLLYLKWQLAIKDLRAVRDPLETGFFENQASIDAKALKLFDESPKEAKNFLTEYTRSNMEKIVRTYRELRDQLIAKYTNNKQGANWQ